MNKFQRVKNKILIENNNKINKIEKATHGERSRKKIKVREVDQR